MPPQSDVTTGSGFLVNRMPLAAELKTDRKRVPRIQQAAQVSRGFSLDHCVLPVHIITSTWSHQPGSQEESCVYGAQEQEEAGTVNTETVHRGHGCGEQCCRFEGNAPDAKCWGRSRIVAQDQ